MCVHTLYVYSYTLFIYTVGVGGNIVAGVPNPAVSSNLLWEIHELQENGITQQGILNRLRCQTVPPGFICTTWKPGMYNKLRSCTKCIFIRVIFGVNICTCYFL